MTSIAQATALDSTCAHPRANRRAIDRLFREGAAPQQKILAHLHSCASCRAYYEQQLTAERLLVHGDVTRASHLEDERLAARIFSALPQGTVAAAPQPAGRHRAPALFAAVTLSLMALTTLVVLQQWTPPATRPTRLASTPGLTAKGTAAPAVAAVTLRALRLQTGAAQPGLTPLEPGANELRLSDELLLLYSNRGEARYAFVLGVGADLWPRWYFPAPPEQQSVRLAPGATDKPLGQPIRLAVNHHAGPLKVFVLLSAKPLKLHTISDALQRQRAAGTSLAELKTIDLSPRLGSVEQQQLQLNILR